MPSLKSEAGALQGIVDGAADDASRGAPAGGVVDAMDIDNVEGCFEEVVQEAIDYRDIADQETTDKEGSSGGFSAGGQDSIPPLLTAEQVSKVLGGQVWTMVDGRHCACCVSFLLTWTCCDPLCPTTRRVFVWHLCLYIAMRLLVPRHGWLSQANLWTEFVDNEGTAEYMLLPRLAAMAEALWSPAVRNNKRCILNGTFSERFPPMCRRLRALRVFASAWQCMRRSTRQRDGGTGPWSNEGCQQNLANNKRRKLLFDETMWMGRCAFFVLLCVLLTCVSPPMHTRACRC